jgi:hypothetical protein
MDKLLTSQFGDKELEDPRDDHIDADRILPEEMRG